MRSILLLLLLLMTVCSYAAMADSLSQRKTKPSTWIGKKIEEEEDERFYFKRHVQPHSINALVDYCEAQWMQEEKDSFKAMPEKVAVNHYHYWTDSWISGMKILLLSDSAISWEFKQKGITTYDEMWCIILTSLHRKLNHHDIDLTTQIEELKKKRKKK